MRPLYIIIHEDCVDDLLKRSLRAQYVKQELIRIKAQELFMIGPGVYTRILDSLPVGLSKNRELRLCGAYVSPFEPNTSCLDVPFNILKNAGYNVIIYQDASLSVLDAKF